MMSCHACSRGLSLFGRSIRPAATAAAPLKSLAPAFLSSRSFSSARPRSLPASDEKSTTPERSEARERPAWLTQKEALREKLGGEAWNPRKKLSPDTMEGIRHLHQTQPDKFTTPILAEHFKVSKDAIRRILKSKWRPSDAEQEERMKRWDRRGERIWSNLVELGVKPPKKWREMGVGKAEAGAKPRWKTGARNSVPVHDSTSDPYEDLENILPIVDGNAQNNRRNRENITLEERLGL